MHTHTHTHLRTWQHTTATSKRKHRISITPQMFLFSPKWKQLFFFAGFYNDLGLDALAVAESNGSVVMVHAAPGFVKTSWGTEMPW
jgi:hypothetical protein